MRKSNFRLQKVYAAIFVILSCGIIRQAARRNAGGGFRALVRARHAVPLCEENWAGRGVVFFEGGSGMNDGYPTGDDDPDRG